MIRETRILFPNLNGLRFTGALTVMLFHCYTLHREIWGDFYQSGWFQAIGKVLNKGHLGVALFFVLSGFLITYLLLDELTRNDRINVLHYFMRRILRVWPLYFVITIFGFFLFPHLPYGVETTHELWRYLLFLSNWDELINGARENLNFLTATWSVSVEEQFYLSWGVLIALTGFRKKGFFPLFFGSVITGVLVFRFFHTGDERTIYFHTFSVVSDLAFGGLLAWLVVEQHIDRFFRTMPRFVLILVYILGFGALFLDGWLLKTPLAFAARLVPECVFGFIVLEQVYSEQSFYKIDRIPGFFEAGKLTYGFYLFHSIFIYYFAHLFQDFHLTDSIGYYALFVALVFGCTYLTAWISFRFFETPLLRLKHYFRA